MFQDPTSTRVGADSSVPGWRTNPVVPPVVVPDATLALIVAPTSGEVSVASADFVVAVNGQTDGDVTLTPAISSSVPPGATGTFTPTTAVVNSASALYDTFTFTPNSVAEYTLALTNDRGLSNPAAFGYSSQSLAPPPLDLSKSWIIDLHPKRPFGASQGTVPAECAGHDGDANSFNLQSQYAGESVQTFNAATAVVQADGDTLDSDSLTRNAYETIRIITDPDNALRSCYSFRIDKTTSGWTTSNKKKVRAQISAIGSQRLTRAWGLDTWFVTAIRVSDTMKQMPPQNNSGGQSYDWVVVGGYHTTVSTDAGGMLTIEYRGGGPTTPELAQLFVRINHATTPTAPYTTEDRVLIAGGAADEVPADTWIYIILNHRLWHGYDDPSSSPVDTPPGDSGDFYVRPFVAIGDGPAVPKQPYEDFWGIPYDANSVGWARPTYPSVQVYTFPSNFSGDLRGLENLGMQEYLASDNPDPTNYETLSAQNILDAFKASRLVTPP